MLGLSALTLCLAPMEAMSATPQFYTPYVTRSEAAMILLKSRLKTAIPDIPSEGRFSDVQQGQWYERYVTLAERYGILEAQARTRRIRPHDVVLRAEFLKMIASAFGLRQNLPHLYRDVSPIVWYSPYAGIASQYGLFPGDTDQTVLKGTSVMTHNEVTLALHLLGKQLDDKAIPTLEQQEVLARARREQLAIDVTTSTQQGEVAVLAAPIRLAPAPLPPPAYEDPVKIPALRQAIIDRVNDERALVGLAPLEQHSSLEASAQRYANDMAANDFFGHISPQGQTLRQRIDASGYYQSATKPCLCVERFLLGENLARGQRTVNEVIDAWMRSASHRQAILTPDFTHVGIGIDSGIWVQHFGGRKTGPELQ